MQDQDEDVVGYQLARLIERHRERTKEKFKQMAARGGLPTTTLQNLAGNPLKQMPQRETLDKVAKALQVDLAVVVRAAGEACGLVLYDDEALPSDPDTQAIISNFGNLTPDQRKAILLQVDYWVQTNNE